MGHSFKINYLNYDSTNKIKFKKKKKKKRKEQEEREREREGFACKPSSGLSLLDVQLTIHCLSNPIVLL